MITSIAIDTQVLPWYEEDEQRLNDFLQTETGKRLIPKLKEQATPPLLATGHVNAILIRSGEVRGVQQVIDTLVALSHAQVMPRPHDNYPAPEDDAAWGDGRTLTAPEKPAYNPDPIP